MKLREIYETKIKILSERKNKAGDTTMRIVALWMVTGRKNRNGRLYSQQLIQREVAKFQDRVKEGSVIGSADHPSGAFTTLDDASHIITKLEIDKQGRGTMEATILPTSKGKNVIEIIKAGGQLGVSARGAGTVSPNGTVESDYRLLGIDFCTNPSEPTAVFNKSNVFESQNFDEEENQNEDLEKQILALEKESYLSACDSGFKGTQEDWDAKYSGSLREMMGLPKKEKEVSVQALEQQLHDILYSYYREAISGGFHGTFDEWKEKFPRIVETAGEAIELSERKASEIKKPFKSKTNWNEVLASGFKGSMQKYREKFPNITLVVPEKPIVETLEQEAQRIFEGLKKDNPNSSLTLESVRSMLEKEGEGKRARKERVLAAFRVSRSLGGSIEGISERKLEKMVEEELEIIREQKAEKKRKNWEAYKRLLSD